MYRNGQNTSVKQNISVSEEIISNYRVYFYRPKILISANISISEEITDIIENI